MLQVFELMRERGIASVTHVIALLRLNEEMGMSEWASLCGVSKGGMTLVSDRLVSCGLVETTHHPSDRRRMVAKRTAAGESTVRKAIKLAKAG